MKKYLISSDYMYYDDFDFSNVCICDTKEKAEELVIEFNKEKEIFKSMKGYIIYLEKELFENSIFSKYDKKYIEEENTITKVFIEKKDFEENYKEILENLESYFQENTYFEFLTFSSNKNDSLIKKYCNHEDSKLSIEEIDYL